MINYVIDASVILRHQLETSSTVSKKFNLIIRQAATKRLQLISIPLFLFEVANALRFQISKSKLAQEAFDRIKALPIKIIPLKSPLYTEAIKLAYLNQTTVYDATYHVLAISQNATFLTCDSDYYKKSHHLGYIKLLA